MDSTEEKFRCAKCNEYLARDKYSLYDNMRLPICGDCYANCYAEDLDDICKLLAEYKKYSILPKDVVQEIMGEDYRTIARYVYSDEENDTPNYTTIDDAE